MSGEEKAAQIGFAVTEFQAAKTELAHIEKKIRTVFSAYYKAGSTMETKIGTPDPPQIKDGRLVLGYSAGQIDLAHLLNSADLLNLVQERDAANGRFEEARAALVSLGITGVA